MGRLDGKVAVVTGASRGIGLGIAQRLVEEGARVCITARKQEALEEAVATLGGPEHAIFAAGAGDDADHRAETVARTAETFGPVDVLVNNTGINPVYGPLIEIDLDAARKIVEVNAISALAWAQEVYRAGMKDRGGAILNVSSVAGVKPAPGIAMYGASKAMLSSITESLAVELGPAVRVNGVAPAVVKTRFAQKLYEGREDEVSSSYPLKRLGVPEDVAAAAAFLVSDDAAWITGRTLVLDGGLTLTGGV